MKRIGKAGLGRFRNHPNELDFSTEADRVLARAVKLAQNTGIQTVIDVGASNGCWSLDLQRLLPDAQFLLFEAAPFHVADLRKIESPTFSVVYAAASNHTGEVSFHLDPDNPRGGGASARSTDVHSTTVACTTIDAAIEARGLEGPYLIKLDAQGHEFEILEGAAATLKQVSLLWVEAYGVDEPGRPPFDELCAHLRKIGFRAAGIADVLARPSDGMLWQMDIAFLPDTHPAFANTKFWK